MARDAGKHRLPGPTARTTRPSRPKAQTTGTNHESEIAAPEDHGDAQAVSVTRAEFPPSADLSKIGTARERLADADATALLPTASNTPTLRRPVNSHVQMQAWDELWRILLRPRSDIEGPTDCNQQPTGQKPNPNVDSSAANARSSHEAQ